MKLGEAYRTIAERYPGNSLTLAPTSPTVVPTQARDLTNRAARGNCLCIGDSTEKPEVHGLRVPAFHRKVKPPSNEN
jgi:hypothetical protein